MNTESQTPSVSSSTPYRYSVLSPESKNVASKAKMYCPSDPELHQICSKQRLQTVYSPVKKSIWGSQSESSRGRIWTFPSGLESIPWSCWCMGTELAACGTAFQLRKCSAENSVYHKCSRKCQLKFPQSNEKGRFSKWKCIAEVTLFTNKWAV